MSQIAPSEFTTMSKGPAINRIISHENPDGGPRNFNDAQSQNLGINSPKSQHQNQTENITDSKNKEVGWRGECRHCKNQNGNNVA